MEEMENQLKIEEKYKNKPTNFVRDYEDPNDEEEKPIDEESKK
jgi:hypothetical protein